MPKVCLFQLLWRVKDSVPSEYVQKDQAQLSVFCLWFLFGGKTVPKARLSFVSFQLATGVQTIGLQDHTLTQLFPVPARKWHPSVPSRSSNLITIWLAPNDFWHNQAMAASRRQKKDRGRKKVWLDGDGGQRTENITGQTPCRRK